MIDGVANPRDQSMIEAFLQVQTPSVTFEEQEQRYQNRLDCEAEYLKEQRKKNEKILAIFKEHKVQGKYIQDPITEEVSQEMEFEEKEINLSRMRRAYKPYEKKFSCKKEGVEYFTRNTREVFEQLGYEYEKRVDLTGFDNVNEYYESFEVAKLYKIKFGKEMKCAK